MTPVQSGGRMDMNIEKVATHLSEYGSTMTTSQFRKVLTDAFTAGERKGRIVGLREAGKLARQNGWHGAWHLAYNEADRLERETNATAEVAQCCERDHDHDGNCDRHPDLTKRYQDALVEISKLRSGSGEAARAWSIAVRALKK